MIWRITLEFSDRDSNLGRCAIHSAATTVAALVALAQGFEAVAGDVSNAVIVGGSISASWRYSLSPAPLTSDVKRKALLLSRQIGPLRYGSLLVPSANYNALKPDRCGLRYVTKTEAPAPLRGAIQALLTGGVVDRFGVVLPSQDWVLAGASDE